MAFIIAKSLIVLRRCRNLLCILWLRHVLPHFHVQRVIIRPLQQSVEISTLVVDSEIREWLRLRPLRAPSFKASNLIHVQGIVSILVGTALFYSTYRPVECDDVDVGSTHEIL